MLRVSSRMLGGSWVGISGVTRPLICFISIVTVFITPLIPTHEPSKQGGCTRLKGLGLQTAFQGCDEALCESLRAFARFSRL